MFSTRYRSLKIGYLVGQFPRLSETFIVDEIKEHRRNGVDLIVIALFPPASSAAMANLGNANIPILYVFRASGRMLRLERLWLAFLALATKWRLWRVFFDARFGSRTDCMNILGLAYRLRAVARRGGIDVLHCHFGTRAHLAAALRSLGLINAKIVTTFHGFDLSAHLKRKGRNHYQLLFRFGSLFLPISEVWARTLRELDCDPARIQVHRVGVDCALNEFRERRRDPRANAPVKLISVGRLVEKKGHAYTLRALAHLRQAWPEVLVTLDIVGEGELADALKCEAAELRVDDVVRFHGGTPCTDPGAAGRRGDLHPAQRYCWRWRHGRDTSVAYGGDGARHAGHQYLSQRHSRAGRGRCQWVPGAGARCGGPGSRHPAHGRKWLDVAGDWPRWPLYRRG